MTSFGKDTAIKILHRKRKNKLIRNKQKWNKTRVQTGSWRPCREPCTAKRWSWLEIWRRRRRWRENIPACRGRDELWIHPMTSFPASLNPQQSRRRTDSQHSMSALITIKVYNASIMAAYMPGISTGFGVDYKIQLQAVSSEIIKIHGQDTKVKL